MVKIKVVVEKLSEGHECVFDKLDRRFEAKGDIVIKDVDDPVYPECLSLDQNDMAYVERIVIYKEKENNVKG